MDFDLDHNEFKAKNLPGCVQNAKNKSIMKNEQVNQYVERGSGYHRLPGTVRRQKPIFLDYDCCRKINLFKLLQIRRVSQVYCSPDGQNSMVKACQSMDHLQDFEHVEKLTDICWDIR